MSENTAIGPELAIVVVFATVFLCNTTIVGAMGQETREVGSY